MTCTAGGIRLASCEAAPPHGHRGRFCSSVRVALEPNPEITPIVSDSILHSKF